MAKCVCGGEGRGGGGEKGGSTPLSNYSFFTFPFLCLACCVFNSPGLKAQANYSDHFLACRPTVCLSENVLQFLLL